MLKMKLARELSQKDGTSYYILSIWRLCNLLCGQYTASKQLNRSERWPWMMKQQREENRCNCLLYNSPSLCAKEQRTTVAQRVHWTATYLTWALTKNKTSGQLHKAHTVRHCNVTNSIPGFFGSFFLQQSIFVKGEAVIQVTSLDPFLPYDSARDLLPCTKWIFFVCVSWKDFFSFFLPQHDSSISSCL